MAQVQLYGHCVATYGCLGPLRPIFTWRSLEMATGVTEFENQRILACPSIIQADRISVFGYSQYAYELACVFIILAQCFYSLLPGFSGCCYTEVLIIAEWQLLCEDKNNPRHSSPSPLPFSFCSLLADQARGVLKQNIIWPAKICSIIKHIWKCFDPSALLTQPCANNTWQSLLSHGMPRDVLVGCFILQWFFFQGCLPLSCFCFRKPLLYLTYSPSG